MDDGLLWAIIIGVVAIIFGLTIARCKYDECIKVGFTEDQCLYDVFWSN